MQPMKFGMGQSVKRSEDKRFITGAGQYATDYMADGALQAYVLRSTHAFARFQIGDLTVAKARKGVMLILTAADLADVGDLPCQAPMKNADGSKMSQPPYPVLAKGEVRHVGDAIAFVVARTLEQAKDAAEAIEVTYEALPGVFGAVEAMAPDAPLVWPQFKSNVAMDTGIGDKAKTDAIFAKADKVVRIEVINNRLVANYMEPRVCTAEYDPSTKGLTLTLGTQGSHGIRNTLAKMLSLDPAKVRVVTPDVGGGFGNKAFMYREYPLLAVAARKLKKPVTWVQERTEHFLSCAQGRDNITSAEMALSKSGKFLAMRVDLVADLGAYLSQFAPYIPYLGGTMTTGCYDIPQAYFRVRGVFTHTLPVDAYRGAGRPEAAYLIERLVDRIAFETGKKPEAVRAQNFIKPSQMPYSTPMGRVYDTGDFIGHMKRAMDVADWAGFKTRLAAAKRKGLIRGIGMGSYIEACGGGSPEPAYVSMQADGTVTVKIGTQSTGQGHETAYAQLVSQHLDLPIDKIRVLQGDTRDTPTGDGTGGSRSIPVGGAGVDIATRALVENLKTLAATELEAGTGDLEIVEGRVRVVGTDRGADFATLAKSKGAKAEMLNTVGSFTPPEATYPNGTHVAEVEVDPDTGAVKVVNYVIVDDFGRTLNPLLLAGQVHGGTVQGIGQALMESTVYGPEGQLLTASFMDYALPRADDVPTLTFETRNVPSTTNLLGVKGAGEAGSIGSCPAVMNALIDALNRAYGIQEIDMPATPQRVFDTIRSVTLGK